MPMLFYTYIYLIFSHFVQDLLLFYEYQCYLIKVILILVIIEVYCLRFLHYLDHGLWGLLLDDHDEVFLRSNRIRLLLRWSFLVSYGIRLNSLMLKFFSRMLIGWSFMMNKMLLYLKIFLRLFLGYLVEEVLLLWLFYDEIRVFFIKFTCWKHCALMWSCILGWWVLFLMGLVYFMSYNWIVVSVDYNLNRIWINSQYHDIKFQQFQLVSFVLLSLWAFLKLNNHQDSFYGYLKEALVFRNLTTSHCQNMDLVLLVSHFVSSL